jgi:hypothetical protein
MTKNEIGSLPQGTKLFIVSRKISRSGMKQVFDVFFIPYESMKENDPRPHWIRLSNKIDGKGDNEATQFNKSKCTHVHACANTDEDRFHGGSFYATGCGYNRALALVESLGDWAADNSKHFELVFL